MASWRTLATFSIVTTALLSCSPARITEESQPEIPSAFEAGSHCPLFVDSCPAGCYLVGGQAIDLQKGCRLGYLSWGCSAMQFGPPAVICSITPEGTLWISLDGRIHPRGRYCADAERRASQEPYPACR
jgi:hypothetical protein